MAVNLSRIVAFNTGRQYNVKGQRIACTVLPDGRVMFADVDRGIDGITKEPYPYGPGFSGLAVQRFVMAEYDYGRINYGWWEPGQDAHVSENMAHTMQELKNAANAI